MIFSHEVTNPIKIAMKAMELFQLHNVDYSFAFNRRERAVGLCDHAREKIFYSAKHIHRPWHDIVDTILHEIAHYLTAKRGLEKGHSEDWKRICIEIGAKPEIYAEYCVKVDRVDETQKRWYEQVEEVKEKRPRRKKRVVRVRSNQMTFSF